jgi:hypothetical protein
MVLVLGSHTLCCVSERKSIWQHGGCRQEVYGKVAHENQNLEKAPYERNGDRPVHTNELAYLA